MLDENNLKFQEFITSNVSYVLSSNKIPFRITQKPDKLSFFESDLDVLVDATIQERHRIGLELERRLGGLLVIVSENSCYSTRFVIVFESTWTYFFLDLSEGLTHSFLKPIIQKNFFLKDSKKSFFRSSEYFVYHVVKSKIGKKKLQKETVAKSLSLFMENEDEALLFFNSMVVSVRKSMPLLLSFLFGRKIASNFDECNFISEKIVFWKMIDSFLSLKNIYLNIQRICKKIIHPPGVELFILGLDGSGKSDLILDFKKKFKDYKIFSYHYRSFFLRKFFLFKKNTQSVFFDDPEGLPSRSFPVNFFRFLEILAEYLIDRIYFRYKRSSGSLVFVDRSSVDLCFHPERYRFSPKWRLIFFLCFKFFPKPDFLIFLNTPLSLITERKSEINRNRMVSLQKRYMNYMFFDFKTVDLRERNLRNSAVLKMLSDFTKERIISTDLSVKIKT
jgi:hypothetical protein